MEKNGSDDEKGGYTDDKMKWKESPEA